MTIQELFVRSNLALARVVAQISDDQWDLKLPPESSRSPATLKRAIQYHTYDDAWVPDVLAGSTMEDVGDVYSFLLTDDSVKPNYAGYNQRAIEAVQGFTDLAKTTHLSYGDFPARDYLQHVTSFRAFRAYDIAKLIGADTTLEADFVQALLEEFSPVVEAYRKMGVYPPALKVSAKASPQARLMAMVGRR